MKEMQLTVAGNVIANPEQHFGHRSGLPFTTFRVAHNRQNFDRESGQWAQTGTDFLKVIAFGSLGLNIVESVAKGDPVVVHGRLSLKEWTQGEKSGTDAEITASAVGWDFNFGQGDFHKVKRPTVSGVDPTDDPSVRSVMRGMGAEPQDAQEPPEDYDGAGAPFVEPVGAGPGDAPDAATGQDEEYAEPAAS